MCPYKEGLPVLRDIWHCYGLCVVFCNNKLCKLSLLEQRFIISTGRKRVLKKNLTRAW